MASNLVQVNWEAQKKVLFSSLGAFRSKEILTDVTLSCDGENFAAHRLVLSMCSGFFKKALNNSTSSSLSLIVMFGIRKSILEALLHFVYDGTTTIRNDDIPDLLSAGKRLEIPGLMDMGSTSNCNSYNSPKQNDGLETGRNASASSFSHEVRSSSELMDFTRNSLEGVDLARNISEGTDGTKKVIKTEVVECSPEKIRKHRKQLVAVRRKDPSFDSDEDSDNGNKNDIRTNAFDKNLKKLEAVAAYDLLPKRGAPVPYKRIHECPICSKSFSRLTSLQEHIVHHDTHASSVYPCNNCGKSFGSERVFISHVRNCATESPRIQPVSMTPFKTSRKQQIQNSASGMSKKSRHDEEGKKMEKNLLGLHQKRNSEQVNEFLISNEQGSSSPLNKNGSKIENLGKENVKKSVATLNNRYCTWCSKIFPTIYKYKDHKKSDCKMLECQYCLSEFELEKKKEYLVHVSTHSGINPYSCPKCDFVTANESSLENHVALLHTGIYRFWCPHCDFQAMKCNDLKVHFQVEHPDVLIAD